MAVGLKVSIQLALPTESQSGGASAKRPAAGPTSRPLRTYIIEDGGLTFQVDISAAIESPSHLPPLFPAKLNVLRAILSLDRVAELIALHIVDTALHLTDIASRRAARDLESVARIAHTISSNSGNLGALHTSALARQLEAGCRRGNAAGTYRLISELSHAHQQAGDEMRAWLNEQASLLWID